MNSGGRDWKELEEVVQRLQAAFHPHAVVERNVKISGRITETLREIDVLITHKFPLQALRVVVECKCWNTKVDVPHVEAFIQKMRDVEAHAGMMVSKLGFSGSAEKVAKNALINLFTFRDTRSETWPNGLVFPIKFELWELRIFAFRRTDSLDCTTDLGPANPDDCVFNHPETGKHLIGGEFCEYLWRTSEHKREGENSLCIEDDSVPPRYFVLGLMAKLRRFKIEGRLHFTGLVDAGRRIAHTPAIEIVAGGNLIELNSDEAASNLTGVNLNLSSTDITPFGVPSLDYSRVCAEFKFTLQTRQGLEIRVADG